MLRKPSLQDKLLRVYRAYYLKCLEERTRYRADVKDAGPKPMEPEPFNYLRNYMGYYSKAEKFLIDFHAGLMQNQRQLKRRDFTLLPPDIGALIRDRWLELCGKVRKDSHHSDLPEDRIAANDSCFRVTEDGAIRHTNLHIQYLYGEIGGRFGLNPPLSTSPHATLHASQDDVDRHGNRAEGMAKRRKKSQTGAPVGTRSSPGDSADFLDLPPKPRLSNPFEASSPTKKSKDPSSSVSPTHLPSDHSHPAPERRRSLLIRPRRRKSSPQPPPRPSVSFAPDLPAQAASSSHRPSRQGLSHDTADVGATDGESVYDLFAPNLGWTDDAADQPWGFGASRVLHFAA